jgi:hypothetical protein
VRSRVLLACAISLVLLVAAPLAARAANEDDGASVLHTGRCLAATAHRPVTGLESSSTRFQLYLSSRDLQIRNEVLLNSGAAAAAMTWRRGTQQGAGGSASLCMQTNGNLVLRASGAVVWSTHTAGTGGHNYALLRNNGRLVVRTGGDRTVWSSHTTPVLLKAGDRLSSGNTLRNDTDPRGSTHLQMQTGGDLVLTRDTVMVWHTATSVRGSYLLVTTMGRLAIYTPAHHVVWRSAAVGRTPLLTVAQLGRLALESFATGRCWVRPAGGRCL